MNNVEDRGHKALQHFDRRTLFNSLCALFATVRPMETSRLLRVLRLFVVVKTSSSSTNHFNGNNAGPTGSTNNTHTCEEEQDNVVEEEHGEVSGASTAVPLPLRNEEIKQRILDIARDHRKKNPDIWNRTVAKRFGIVLKMFRDVKSSGNTPPPSPTRPMVRNISIGSG